MKYIYIDESGDLGDNYSSSKYFVLAAIIVNNPKTLNRIIKETKRKYPNIIGRDLEVKGNKQIVMSSKRYWVNWITLIMKFWQYFWISNISIKFQIIITIMNYMTLWLPNWLKILK